MSKEKAIEQEGKVVEVLAGGRFRVELPNKHVIIAERSGRVDYNRIRIVSGDRVRLAISPYDLDKGRIIYRYK